MSSLSLFVLISGRVFGSHSILLLNICRYRIPKTFFACSYAQTSQKTQNIITEALVLFHFAWNEEKKSNKHIQVYLFSFNCFAVELDVPMWLLYRKSISFDLAHVTNFCLRCVGKLTIPSINPQSNINVACEFEKSTFLWFVPPHRAALSKCHQISMHFSFWRGMPRNQILSCTENRKWKIIYSPIEITWSLQNYFTHMHVDPELK